ncbi:hypothetical protein CRD36_10465 [Paremcibacter congregatus]|uniref:Secretin/TonB short N-terminal domain-containing protein n=3 Tax=Paremcibacter congregatus TaxID=2043170 RepID=A0A2G4YQU9_9PROT|nr:hypothetical protein CRD36_10465 [Paremcibacter congregatus]QDE28896.1 TonB-dependent receptor [Paremcibacter congregatus]
MFNFILFPMVAIRSNKFFLTFSVILACGVLSCVVQASDRKFHFRLMPGSLEKNIFMVAKTANVQIFFFPEIMVDKTVPQEIYGNYTLESVLDHLLAGSDLVYIMNADDTVILKEKTVASPFAVQPENGTDESIIAKSFPPRRFDEIITIGTRRSGRTITDSAIPIDILQPDMVTETGYVDMTDAFRTLIPSFNAKRLSLNDGASFVRPITMRSSPADHVLLLMNGKRRHRSATVMIGTGHATTSGSQGSDFNVIPLIAIKDIEILRDGASALYGSDAIAGVVNMALKDTAEGGEVATHIGQYYQGGGLTFDTQANMGVPVSDAGFLNLSVQYTRQEQTRSSDIHAGAQALREAGVSGVPWPATNIGEPSYEALKTAWNGGVRLGDQFSLYFFGNYMRSESAINFFYRQSLAGGGLGAHAAYAKSQYDGTAAHPEAFDLKTIYPGGFTPRFSGLQTDFSQVAGLKFDNGTSIQGDVSFRWGENKVKYHLWNTINPSMGSMSPTSFMPGSLHQREYQIEAGVLYNLAQTVFFSDVTLSAGTSYRHESYRIGEGDPASYAIGPLRDLPVGSNGFQGYSPDIAGTFGTGSYSMYLDFETDVTEGWSVAIAGRYEDYNVFGDNFSYRLTSRLELNNSLALRGAISSGFRAPAVGQLFGTSQTSQMNLQGDFILDAVLVLGSEAARIFGAVPLKPETSFNLSGGIVAQFDNGLTFTLDFYQIDVDDRLLLLDTIPTTADQREQLAAIGYPNGQDIQEVRFFQNKLDTRVRGADMVTTYEVFWQNAHATEISFSLNYNQQILRTEAARQVFSESKKYEFEEGIPHWNGNLSLTHQAGPVRLVTRATYYGGWKRRGVVEGAPFLVRKPAVLLDFQALYALTDRMDIYMGGRNMLNKRPPLREALYDKHGVRSDNHSVYGVSGGYYYIGLNYFF